MLPKFKSILQLYDFFKDESTCISYLEQQRWGGKPYCPHCGHDKVYRTNRGFKCANKECHKKFSATSGSIFDNTKISLRVWYAAIYVCTAHKKGISSLQLSRDLGVTQKTAWFVLHRVREMLKETEPKLLKHVVEVDEVFIGGKNHNRHLDKRVQNARGRSMLDKAPVFGAVQRGGDLRLSVVPDTTTLTLKDRIDCFVKPNSIMVSDDWYAYRKAVLPNNRHVVVNHKYEEYVRGAFHTNTIESFWALLKRGNYGIYHYWSRKHLHRYLVEFGYRYNSRSISDQERFDTSLRRVGNFRLRYKDLIK